MSHASENIHNPTAPAEIEEDFSQMSESTNVLPTPSLRPVMPENIPIQVDRIFKKVIDVIEERWLDSRCCPAMLVDYLSKYFKPEIKCAYFIKYSVAKEIMQTTREMLKIAGPLKIDWETEMAINKRVNEKGTKTCDAMFSSMLESKGEPAEGDEITQMFKTAEWRALLFDFPALAVFFHNQQMCCNAGAFPYCPLDYLDDDVEVVFELPKKCGFASSSLIKVFREYLGPNRLHYCSVCDLKNEWKQKPVAIKKSDKKDSSVQVTIEASAQQIYRDEINNLAAKLIDSDTKIVRLEKLQSTSEDTIAQLRKQLEELKMSHEKELILEREKSKENKKLLEEMTKEQEKLEKTVIEKNKKLEETGKRHKDAVEMFNRQKKENEENAKKEKNSAEKMMKEQKLLAEKELKKQKELVALARSQKKEADTYASRQKKLAEEQKEMAEKEVKKQKELEEKLERQKKAYEENAIRQKKLAEKALKDQREMAEREIKKQKEYADKVVKHQRDLAKQWKDQLEALMDKNAASTSTAGDVRSRYSINDYVTYINEGVDLIKTAKQELAEFLAITNVVSDMKMAQTEYDGFELTIQMYLGKAQRNYEVLKNNRDAENYELLDMELVEPKVFSKLLYAKMEAARGMEEETEVPDCYICDVELTGRRPYKCWSCKQMACYNCIERWAKTRMLCPMCNRSLRLDDFPPP